MIFNEFNSHVNTSLGLVGECIPCIPPCVLAWLRIPAFAWGVWDKKFFVRVTECCLNPCESYMSKKFNAAKSLRYKGIATFSSDVETIDGSFRLSGTSGFVSKRHSFSIVLWERSAQCWLQGFTFLLYRVFKKSICWLWNEQPNKLPPAMKHELGGRGRLEAVVEEPTSACQKTWP